MATRQQPTQLWHGTYSSESRLPLFSDEGAIRAAVRGLTRSTRNDLVLFNLVDSHGHAALALPASECRRRFAAILKCHQPVAAVRLEQFRVRPIDGRSHLENVVGYLLRQTRHHGIAEHPALWTGSCFSDLVGTRVVSGLRLRIFEFLPRLTSADLCARVGIPSSAITPASNGVILAAGAGRLVDAAAFACAADRRLSGRTREEVDAKRAAAHIARLAGLPLRSVADALGLQLRETRNLAAAVDPRLEAAVRSRVALELFVRDSSCASPRANAVPGGDPRVDSALPG